jgi:hypothetical protein
MFLFVLFFVLFFCSLFFCCCKSKKKKKKKKKKMLVAKRSKKGAMAATLGLCGTLELLSLLSYAAIFYILLVSRSLQLASGQLAPRSSLPPLILVFPSLPPLRCQGKWKAFLRRACFFTSSMYSCFGWSSFFSLYVHVEWRRYNMKHFRYSSQYH